jgi:signal transduction histidine kinase
VTYLQTVFATKQPAVISDTTHDPQWVDIFDEVMVFSHITVPILVREEIIGLLNLDSYTPNFFAAKHLRGLELFATQAATALQNAQLYQRAQELAIIEERQRLSNDLHDAVSQMLFTSCILADSLPRYLDRDLVMVRNQLEQLKRLNRGALAEMRKLLLELHSEMLGEVDIQKLLQQLAQAAMGHTQIDVKLETDIEDSMPSNAFQVEIYRIVQEALNNVVKHAQAKRAKIRLVVADGHGDLSIEDDGLGFDPNSIPAGHMGLNIMKNRAERIGASFQVMSFPQDGTKIHVTWETATISHLSDQLHIGASPHDTHAIT